MEKVRKIKIFSIGLIIFLFMLTTVVSNAGAWTLEKWKNQQMDTMDQW